MTVILGWLTVSLEYLDLLQKKKKNLNDTHNLCAITYTRVHTHTQHPCMCTHTQSSLSISDNVYVTFSYQSVMHCNAAHMYYPIAEVAHFKINETGRFLMY